MFAIDRITQRPEGICHCSYPGHARHVTMGVWHHLCQFMFTRFIVVADDDVNARTE